jgi:hypothetical protein
MASSRELVFFEPLGRIDVVSNSMISRRHSRNAEERFMKEDRVNQKRRNPCSVKYEPAPEFITCPKCGEEIELWSDDEETICLFCRHKVFKRETTIH